MTLFDNIKFKGEIQEYLNKFFPEGFVNDIPNNLFHYTTTSGLKGMFTSQKLWLTSFKFQNDRSELTHGLEIFDAKIKEFLKREMYTDEFRGTCKDVLEYILRQGQDPELCPYIFCLSNKDDLLSQWRAYSEDGAGYNIEYSTEKLREISFGGSPINFGIIQYEPDMKEALMADMSQQWLDLVQKVAAESDNVIKREDFGDLAILLIQSAFIIAIKSKDPGFHEESEFRIFAFVRRGNREIKFRQTANGLANYIEVDLPSGSVLGVKAGPKNSNYEGLSTELANLPSVKAFGSVKISKSKIPYR